MGKILLKNIIHENVCADVEISEGKITRICPAGTLQSDSDTDLVPCDGKVILPGFVNMHTHAAMTLMRGIGEDITFHDWLDKIWQVEENIDEEYVYNATKVACLEMIKTGTTTFADHYWYMPMARKAALELGVRPVLAYVICDRNNLQEAERQKKQCAEIYEQSLLWPEASLFTIAVHAIYSVSEEMILWASEFARERGLKIHIHLSETEKEVEDCMKLHQGMSPVEYLDSLGVLGPDVIAAHTLWLSDHDIEILGRNRVTCVHNVNSNLKLASGYRFRYNELRDAGANICLGTDGCASSNNLDMLETMKTSAMIQKAWRNDPSAMPLNEVIAMTTENAGKALGLNVGKIEEGAEADLLIIDTDNHNFISPGSFLANLIYSAHSDCVEHVICKGHFVMRNRVVPGEKEILAQARESLKKII